jgi:hypothetical protein
LRRRRRFFGFGASASSLAGPASVAAPSAAAGASAPGCPFLRRLRRRRERFGCVLAAGRFSARAAAISWIVPSRSFASSSSRVAVGV